MQAILNAFLPSDRFELCFERLLELLGREHAPGVDVRKSFANRRAGAERAEEGGREAWTLFVSLWHIDLVLADGSRE